MLAGCAAPTASDHSSSRAPRPYETTVEFAVEGIVYEYLLERDFWKGGDFSAIFLRARDQQVAEIIRKFPNHVPKIKPIDRVRLQPGASPIDKETGRPAMLLAAVASEPEGDRVEAIGTYYAGPMVKGKYEFRLSRVGREWKIESVK